MKFVLKKIISLYQLLFSSTVGQSCRFTPTCSHYALESIERFGSMHGGFLTIKRVIRCGPWCEGGVDPVPDR